VELEPDALPGQVEPPERVFPLECCVPPEQDAPPEPVFPLGQCAPGERVQDAPVELEKGVLLGQVVTPESHEPPSQDVVEGPRAVAPKAPWW
jgi:hypothetical protein